MSWIKRNLIFVAFSGVAVVLLGLAGWYSYSAWNLNNESSTKLTGAYTELKNIADEKPNPGNDKTDNIKIAKELQADVRQKLNVATKYFTPIQAIPSGVNVSSEAFAAALRRTVEDLTRGAANTSVTIPPKYDFSFAAQRPLVKFAGSLDPLATQLGEVKAICDVLFSAKINTLYSLRRVRVSEDDLKGSQSDYLELTPTTNDLAILNPYEITFYGFSSEVASVLTGFANSRHAFIVTTLNVEPGTPATAAAEAALTGGMPGGYPQPNPYGRYPNGFGRYPTPEGPAMNLGQPNQPAAALGRGGLPIVLDERQLKVTMGINVVKLLPKK